MLGGDIDFRLMCFASSSNVCKFSCFCIFVALRSAATASMVLHSMDAATVAMKTFVHDSSTSTLLAILLVLKHFAICLF